MDNDRSHEHESHDDIDIVGIEIDDNGEIVGVVEQDVVVEVDDHGDVEDILVLEETQIELPVWEPTGDAEVDAAIALLSGLDDADLAGHDETFAQVHRQLRQRLTDVASG